MSISVVVADDQEIVRTGLTMILNAQPGIEVVGEAADGRQAVELARRLRPDVCLFDIRMPELDGIEATRAAGRARPSPTRSRWSSSPRSTSTSTSTRRCGPAPAASCSRTPGRPCSPRPCTPPRTATRSSPRASPPGCSQAFAAAGPGERPRPARRPAHRPRGAGPRRRRPGPHQRRDRRGAVHHAQHGEDPRHQPDAQAGRAEPGRDRDLGVRDRAGPAELKYGPKARPSAGYGDRSALRCGRPGPAGTIGACRRPPPPAPDAVARTGRAARADRRTGARRRLPGHRPGGRRGHAGQRPVLRPCRCRSCVHIVGATVLLRPRRVPVRARLPAPAAGLAPRGRAVLVPAGWRPRCPACGWPCSTRLPAHDGPTAAASSAWASARSWSPRSSSGSPRSCAGTSGGTAPG